MQPLLSQELELNLPLNYTHIYMYINSHCHNFFQNFGTCTCSYTIPCVRKSDYIYMETTVTQSILIAYVHVFSNQTYIVHLLFTKQK